MTQHQDLLGQLASIRERQGLEPIPDPTKIQGPPAVYDPVADRLANARSYPEDHLETPDPEPYEDPEPSPLVTLARPWSPPTVAGITAVVPTVQPYDLFVGDAVGRYKGWEVELEDSEQKAIIAVIHGAFRRRMEAQFESVTGRPMRRTRTVKAVVQKRKGRTPREHPPA